MNDLLFYTLLTALLYYFFIYLPAQKKLNTQPSPIFNTQETQTETISSDTLNEIEKLKKDNQQKERTIIGLNNSYEKLETKTKQELNNLKKQLAEKDAQ